MTDRVRIQRAADKPAVAQQAGSALVRVIQQAQAQRGEAVLALTGGSMGSAVIEAAVALPPDGVDWSRVHVWWGDERYLPSGDPERNDTQNEAAGLSSVGIPAEQIHRVQGPDEGTDLDASAAAYAEALREVAAFDLVLLGVGPDGHVASLFPGHPALRETAAAIAVRDSPKPPPDRVSLSFRTLNHARAVWFLVAGADKASAVAAALSPGADPYELPAAGVQGSEDTCWWLDQAAAADLPEADPVSG